jgi:Icc protein
MTFSFIHISDHHILDTESALIRGFSSAYAFRKVLEHIARHQAGKFDFLVMTGDNVNAATPAAYRTLAGLLGLPADPDPARSFPAPLPARVGEVSFPVYCLPGNHDDHDHFYRQFFPQSVNLGLANASFVHQGVRFIFLDMGPEVQAQAHPATIEFLGRCLQDKMPAVILLHHHVTPIGSRWLDEFIADDVARFWESVQGQNVLGVFCGHTHISYELKVGEIPVLGVRSTAIPFVLQDEPLIALLPPHYRRVTVDEGKMTSEIFEVGL